MDSNSINLVEFIPAVYRASLEGKPFYECDSELGKIKIVDVERVNCRSLLIGKQFAACMELASGKSIFRQLSTMESVFLPALKEAPRCLIIGHGAGLMCKAILEARPKAELYSIDVLPQLFFLAREYFKCPANVTCIEGDGLEKTRELQGGFDLIYMDAFVDEENNPAHLVFRGTLELFFSKLNSGGLLFFSRIGFPASREMQLFFRVCKIFDSEAEMLPLIGANHYQEILFKVKKA